ncbi:MULTISPECIES: helix-turn-helix domain-containing protein [Alicyclobacillus]|uniref:helix-turn-helix domain-containing protein n=1 Tax=Alicyclobacillus TaxID=29330 RepID=UPI00082F03A8|nr:MULTISPECIES: helix-turn-helix transcriptional regulator [Alicyclobacillus]
MSKDDKGNRELHPSVGLRLKHYRKEKGLSLYDLSKLINVSPSYLNRIENGERKAVSTPILKSWCEALGISMYQLLNVPVDAEEERTLFDLLMLYKYTVANGIEATPEIKAAIFALDNQVVNSDLTGEKSYQDAILILERAKELNRLIKQACH